VFEEVTRRRTGRDAAKRVGFAFGSAVFQVGVVAAIIAISAAIRTKVVEPQQVEVKFLKALSPPPPAPEKARAERDRPEERRTPPTQVLAQPREIRPESRRDPDPPEPEERDSIAEPGTVGGVTSGPANGVVGGVPGSAVSSPVVEEGPAYPTAGFRKPQMAEAGCVQRSLRIPEEWMDRLGVVTVKFAIGKDGVPSRFQSMSHGFADRIAPAIWRAVQSCRWIAGADAQGRPTAIWVLLPIRFTLE